MRELWIAALVLACAQAAAAQQTKETCQQSRDTIGAYFGVPSNIAPVELVDGWCVLSDVTLGGGDVYSPVVGIDRLTWQSDGAFGFANGTITFPAALTINLEGLRIGVSVGDPVMDYLMQVQRQPNPINASLAMNWDVSTRILTLSEVVIDFPGENAVTGTGSVANIDPSSISALESSIFGARLTSLDLSVQSNGLFETYLLMPFGQFLLSGSEDPKAEVAFAKATFERIIAEVPDTVLATQDRAALSALVADMPNPAGTIRLSVASETGFGMNNLAPVVMSGVGAALENLDAILADVDLTFDYQRQP